MQHRIKEHKVAVKRGKHVQAGASTATVFIQHYTISAMQYSIVYDTEYDIY
jgi:hypothetical protein